MNIIESVKNLIGIRPAFSSFELMSTSKGRTRPIDGKALVGANTGWVYVCASRNAETIAGVPLRLYVRSGSRAYYGKRAPSIAETKHLERITGKSVGNVQEITDGHPLTDLLDYVNGEQTRTELITLLMLYLELTGDCYLYVEPGPMNMPAALWPLASQYVRVIRNNSGELVGYTYGKSSESMVALDASEVLHIRYANPADPDYGLSPLAATFGAATLLKAQQEYEQTMMDSGGMPEVGLLVKGQVTDEQRKQLYADWARKFSNRRKGDKVVVLQGDMDIKTFGLPPKDVTTQWTQRFSREEILAAFGVPTTLVELSEASRAGAEAGHYAYMRYTIEPKLRLLEQKLTEQLASRYDARLFFAFDEVVPGDREYRLKEITTRLNTRMTSINEERALDGLDPVDWGDEPVIMVPVLTEPVKSVKSVPPLTRSERTFTGELMGYFDDMRKDVLRRLDALD